MIYKKVIFLFFAVSLMMCGCGKKLENGPLGPAQSMTDSTSTVDSSSGLLIGTKGPGVGGGVQLQYDPRQSFQGGNINKITKIRVGLSRYSGNYQSDITIQVTSYSTGTKNVLASSTAKYNVLASEIKWYDFTFASPLNIGSGTYFIEVFGPAEPIEKDIVWNRGLSDYPDGDGDLSYYDDNRNIITKSFNSDYSFEIY